MTILLGDPRVASVPLAECGDPLVTLGPEFGPARVSVRRGVAERLDRARNRLPAGIGMRVVEGHHSTSDQQRSADTYAGDVAASHPGIGTHELDELVSRYAAPTAVAPHPAGAAVDLTLTDLRSGGSALDLGTPIGATPEQSAGTCYFDAPGITALARSSRVLLGGVLGSTGMINYPTTWWHWSYGDRYWALLTRSGAALYGPSDLSTAPQPAHRSRTGRRSVSTGR